MVDRSFLALALLVTWLKYDAGWRTFLTVTAEARRSDWLQ
jgi:hypothetical protein